MIFLDTNVIIDLFSDGRGAEAAWSMARYGDAVAAGAVVCNQIVLAELAGHAPGVSALRDRLDRLEIRIMSFADDAAFSAGSAFREYRRRGGAKTAILADFLIAGHAAVLGASLVTRDRQLATYFPDLTLITPETHHG